MSAVIDTLETVRSATQTGYKWGFETDIEMELAPKGLNEGTIRVISAHKKEPDWLLAWRPGAHAANGAKR
jgi:Fe-S cluster assembly protein SufB